jgi:Family of unknown function (DUF6496)
MTTTKKSRARKASSSSTSSTSNTPRYSAAASKRVESALHREKKGTLKSGPAGKGGAVKTREQAIAIGLSEARKAGAKVPPRKPAAKRKSRTARQSSSRQKQA